jgi:hypothetical protein
MRTQRLGTIPLLALTAVIALIFGSVGSATASGLTKGVVKKIATKVVKKEAPGLSVAHATSADTLQGFSPSQLRTTGYRYSLPTQAAANRIYPFPGLPPGNYLATYDFTANVSGANPLVSCSFDNGPGLIMAPSYSVTPGATVIRESGAAIVTVGAGFELQCSGTAFSMNSGNDNNVSFVPIDLQLIGTTTGARGADRSGSNDGSQ